MESLTKPELLMLFSILEGELEARDLVIEALKVQESRSHNHNNEVILFLISNSYQPLGLEVAVFRQRTMSLTSFHSREKVSKFQNRPLNPLL